MRLEEQALSHAFPEYTAYASRTPRLLPRLARASGTHALAGAHPASELPPLPDPRQSALAQPASHA
jgi:hypothetical protein